MSASFPFRCANCQRLHYTQNVRDVPPVCCEGFELQRLVSICLLIPATKDEKPVHVTQPDAKIQAVSKSWVLACGRTQLPPVFTDQPSACTCQKCREYAEEIYSEAGISLDVEQDLQNTHLQIEFEEDSPPPNPFA